MTTKLRPIAVLLLVLGLVQASTAEAQTARIVGTVLDESGAPIQGVTVVVRSLTDGREIQRTTDKKGGFKLVLLKAVGDFVIILGKEGYQTFQEPFDPKAGSTMRISWTLVEGASGGAVAEGSAAPGSIDASSKLEKKYTDALADYNEGDFEAAIEKFGEIVEARPEIPEPYLGLALAWSRKEDYATSLEWANKYLEMKPDDPMGLRARFRAYRETGDRENELATLDALVLVDRSPEVARFIFNEGVTQLQDGEFEAAANRFLKVHEIDPERDPAYNALARVYYDMGNYDESMAWANRLSERDPDNAEILGLMYLIYTQQGEEAKASEIFERIKGISPEFLGDFFYQQGLDLFNDGKTDQARTIFEGILEAVPDHPGATYSLALCEMNAGNTPAAKVLLERFLVLTFRTAGARRRAVSRSPGC